MTSNNNSKPLPWAGANQGFRKDGARTDFAPLNNDQAQKMAGSGKRTMEVQNLSINTDSQANDPASSENSYARRASQEAGAGGPLRTSTASAFKVIRKFSVGFMV